MRPYKLLANYLQLICCLALMRRIYIRVTASMWDRCRKMHHSHTKLRGDAEGGAARSRENRLARRDRLVVENRACLRPSPACATSAMHRVEVDKDCDMPVTARIRAACRSLTQACFVIVGIMIRLVCLAARHSIEVARESLPRCIFGDFKRLHLPQAHIRQPGKTVTQISHGIPSRCKRVTMFIIGALCHCCGTRCMRGMNEGFALCCRKKVTYNENERVLVNKLQPWKIQINLVEEVLCAEAVKWQGWI
mmetsp:Transcript_30926/g.51215  ORF Transcript_30926/g.51215 Transcript_30926/m.51215 type:complete len:250 (+) Transcript_30926:254-1003(+)